tara:strand:+ start:4564 stop:5028 length:465 start_codon:yes stop_codon:yes gene_type:complete
MKNIKILAVVLSLLLVVVGISYALTSSTEESSTVGGASVSVTKTSERDFERNVFVVETSQNSVITYSISQTKNLLAGLKGIKPKHLLVHQGDTVNLAIHSKVNCDFVIDGYNIDAKTRRDTITEVQFNADLAGMYPYRCDGFLRQHVGIIEVVE